MNKKTIILFVTFLFPLLIKAQEPNMNQSWSLSDCIDYALNQKIQVRQSIPAPTCPDIPEQIIRLKTGYLKSTDELVEI